jgi:hypothetical protein
MSPVQIAKDWWLGTPLQRFTVICSAISASAAAIIALMHFGEVAEPYWFATRDFTRQIIHASEKSNSEQFTALQIATKESARDNTQAQIDRLDYELRKNPDTSDSVKQIISEQIRRYTEQLRILNLELDDLRRRRSGRRP